MAVLNTSGRTAMAVVLRSRPLHFAWGTGDPAWDDAPIAESLDATALVNELGRVGVTSSAFATPDDNGEVEVPSGRFTLGETPTNHLYLRFDFGFADAADQVIREAGLFIDTAVDAEVPAGQRYFTPDNLTDPGTLVALEHFPVVIRTPLQRQQFEFVLKI